MKARGHFCVCNALIILFGTLAKKVDSWRTILALSYLNISHRVNMSFVQEKAGWVFVSWCSITNALPM